MRFKKFVGLIVVILLSASIIFFQFNKVPQNLSFDEVEFGRLAKSLEGTPYQPYSNLATGHPTLYFYIIFFSFKVFGVNNFGLRFPSALFGILSVLFFYLIIKKIFNKQGPLFFVLSALIFLSSRWFFNFARFSFEATLLLFLELASIYFLFMATGGSNKKSPQIPSSSEFSPQAQWLAKTMVSRIFLILSGLFAGLAFNSYTPGRIFFLLPLSFLLFKKWNKSAIKQLLFFLVPFIIITAPLSLYLLRNQDARVDRLLFWKNQEMTIAEKVNGTLQNITSISGMFNIKGDLNGRHNYPGKPALNPILGILFIAGLIISIRDWKSLYNRFFMFYFIVSLFPSIMIYPWENPNMLRTFTAIPAVVYFIGQAITAAKRNVWQIIIVILILLSSIYEVRTYFKYQAPVFDKAFEIRKPLNKIIK
ncbi:hypothetical protein A2970_00550 [Candidatus Roizmanbacteria bacterium RIFCSPLOWO2_01_FULL_44_13]|uniref:Glycosyltransferase RgtA/B/C/D-like domain-containing protein n=1 Tax=Candidatus Roizmanbacteria bacterium RIFCSPLOWO2_01_FULL_44_13 TaxID=1802069 RepID=A0A1F7JBY2_9BACT|nr:MAG: hypothetical protein A2970_00550 [Candidatus Roizmanbacteria bacterium RIFCSPLOWO2_01_FULL_44_13]